MSVQSQNVRLLYLNPDIHFVIIRHLPFRRQEIRIQMSIFLGYRDLEVFILTRGADLGTDHTLSYCRNRITKSAPKNDLRLPFITFRTRELGRINK